MPARSGVVPSGPRYGVEVRAAQPVDAPEIARLLASVGLPLPTLELTERLEAIRVHATAAALVATGYGGLSGVVALCWAPSLHVSRPVARITALVVDPEERRRGIGRLLLKAASQAARMAGCDVVEIAAPPGQAAEAFCRETGFVAQASLFDRVLRKRT